MIFNKSNNGAAELKELIGFIYKSINFANLKTYITFAERDIRKVIGDVLFAQALNHYNSDNYLADPSVLQEGAPHAAEHPEYAILDELVKNIQLPVAVNAYRQYVPSADLSHSDKGRQIFVSEQEKPAFEWQIEKDNDNLLKLEHIAIDLLLEFLEMNKDFAIDLGEERIPLFHWKQSPQYLQQKDLFIESVEEFEKVFPIGGSRYTYLSLIPFIRRVQDNEIRACMTAERYSDLHRDFLAGSLDDDRRAGEDPPAPCAAHPEHSRETPG